MTVALLTLATLAVAILVMRFTLSCTVLKITTAEGAKAAKLHKENPYAPLCALRVLGGFDVSSAER